MPYLLPKARSGNKWLPTQVMYGMDTSDPDPANWKPFGELAEREAEAAAKKAQQTSAKGGQPAQ